MKHREGGDPSSSRKSPGRTEFEAITLERGVTHDTEFEKWANKVWNFGSGLGAEVSLKDFRKDIIIDVYNEAGQLAISYKVFRSWVSEFQALSDLDANANAVAIQHIKLEKWEPGTAPKLVDPYTVTYSGTDLSVPYEGLGPRQCSGSPMLQNVRTRQQDGDEWAGEFDVPVLCDVLGITGSGILLGHWNSDRLTGDWNNPDDGNGTVVALDINGADSPFEDPALRRVVATAVAPERVTFASDLIEAALDADGGAS